MCIVCMHVCVQEGWYLVHVHVNCCGAIFTLQLTISSVHCLQDEEYARDFQGTLLTCICHVVACSNNIELESVDSLCRDGTGPPIVCIHWKAVLTRERACSKPFWTPSYPILTFLHPMIPPR